MTDKDIWLKAFYQAFNGGSIIMGIDQAIESADEALSAYKERFPDVPVKTNIGNRPSDREIANRILTEEAIRELNSY